MSDALVTDLYGVTMSLAYAREGITEPATFSLFIWCHRALPEAQLVVHHSLDVRRHGRQQADFSAPRPWVARRTRPSRLDRAFSSVPSIGRGSAALSRARR